MLTRLEVVDDAIKIGFGSFIALVGVLLTNRHQRKTEIRRRRLDVIQTATNDFVRHGDVFIRLQASQSTLLKLLAGEIPFDPNTPSARLGYAAAKTDAWDEVQQMVKDEVGPSLLGLTALRAQLVVVGAIESATEVKAFGEVAALLQLATNCPQILAEAQKAIPEWESIVAALARAWLASLNTLSRASRGADPRGALGAGTVHYLRKHLFEERLRRFGQANCESLSESTQQASGTNTK